MVGDGDEEGKEEEEDVHPKRPRRFPAKAHASEASTGAPAKASSSTSGGGPSAPMADDASAPEAAPVPKRSAVRKAAAGAQVDSPPRRVLRLRKRTAASP
mmetsp:Transcript_8970/g.29717  ORF Transcript_8970/g.29717 Transcript_8970/m.29717 type:complete len:100 (+) Transcript_8970:28-327(+)|eukprot:scaffold8270_cov124-Isochrysis_galbana.AAC.3